MKLNITEKSTGKTQSVDLDASKVRPLVGLRIGNTVEGLLFERPGERFVITGGSDISGIPMVEQLQGSVKRSMLLKYGKGQRKYPKGQRTKKMVRGNAISEDTAQINLVKVE